MKKTKIIIQFIIILFGSYLLILNWSFFKDIYENLTTSDYEKFLAYDNQRIMNDPDNPSNYLYRGILYKKNKKYNEALKDFLKSYELDNSMSLTVFDEISNTYLALGDTEKALYYVKALMKKAPYPKNFIFDLAIIYDYQWNHTDAVKNYSENINIINNNDKYKRELLYSLKRRAVHYVLLSDYTKAKEDIDRVLKDEANNKVARMLRDILKNQDKIDNEIIKNKFKIDVYEATVEINE